MSPPAITSVVFDCGDTLVGLSPSREAICRDALLELRLDVPLERIELAYRLVDFRLSQKSSQLITPEEKRAFHTAYNRALCIAMGLESSARQVDAALYQAFRERRNWVAFDGTRAALETLSRRYTLYVLANWDAGLEAVLLAAGIRSAFKGVYASAELGAEKPDPLIFREFIGRSGCQPHGAVYVGNEYLADVVGSRAAGFQPVLFDRCGHYGKAVDCSRVESWSELLDLLE